MFKPLSCVAAALLFGAPMYAQDRTGAIDEIFSWATAASPGCVVGVSRGGEVVVNRAYGLADIERGVALTPGFKFDIGSTQKQFTAAAILLLVQEGRLSLSEDIRKYVPELHDYGHRITLDHLLAHTSGIRDWTGMRPLAAGDPDVMSLILRQRALNFAPGEEWSYSNSGFELLKEIVARTSGMSFADFTRTRLFEPLGMSSTEYVPDALAGSGNVALAYERDGAEWKRAMLLGNARGGGALLSTAGDLLIWNDALTSGRLGAFVTEKLQEPARLNNGRQLTYGRGLMVNTYEGKPLLWHSGGAAGYGSWLGRLPGHDLSMAVLCNQEGVSASRLADRVGEQFLPDSAAADASAGTSPAAASAAGLVASDLERKSGLYFSEDAGAPVRLTVSDGRLRIEGGPPLVPLAADRFRGPRGSLFFRSGDEFTLNVLSPDRFELVSMEGHATRYRRARPYSPAAAELQAFAGRYGSDEIGSVFEVLPGESGLVVRLEHSPERALAFAPVERDVFQFSRMTLRFVRDPSGKVVALDYGNPVIRSVRFTRLGDGTAIAAAAAQPSSPPDAVSPAADAAPAPPLAGFTGEYELAPGRTLAITLENGRLHGQPPGAGKRALTHVSSTTFSVADSPMTLTFMLDTDGRATAVVMRQSGRERILAKVR